nr:pyruvate formate lyase-activating protein [Clostridia bacterium]
MSSQGYIHSLQSLGTVDGPGVRAVVFSSGCPLRCIYCHNPDTWRSEDGEQVSVGELTSKIKRLYPYIKNGGVTLSGGEPCMQAEFFTALIRELKAMGLHIALDTSGAVYNERVDELLSLCDLVLLDIKFTSEEKYRRYTLGSLEKTLRFLDRVTELGIPVWIRQVIVPGINDTEADAKELRAIIKSYPTVEKIELLPFRKLCLEKYGQLGLKFPLESTPEPSAELMARLEEIVNG